MMDIMKMGLLAELYRKVGEGLGLLDTHKDADRSARINAALDILADVQREWREKGLTQADIRRMVEEGRA